ALEMLLIRLCRRPPLVPIDDLVSRLAAMERRLGQGLMPTAGASGAPNLQSANAARRPPVAPAPAAAPHPASRPRPREEHTSPARQVAKGDAAEDEPDPASWGSLDGSAAPAQRAIGARTVPSDSSPLSAGGADLVSASQERGFGAPTPSASTERASNVATPPISRNGSGAPERHSSPNLPSVRERPTRVSDSRPPQAAQRLEASTLTPQTQNNQESPRDHAVAHDESELMAIWQELVERVMATRPEVSAVLEHAVLLEVSSKRILVGWPPNSVFCNQFPQRDLADWIRTAAGETGRAITDVDIVENDPRATEANTLSSREIAERTRKYRADQARIRNHPRVKDALEILGGRLVSIKLADH
ncbi:MAG TPA: hypothetical protein VKP30_21430, partial [Polyangiaceae bacterium]|nr:hypothetical protein [Polyangiaceae bacterium]